MNYRHILMYALVFVVGYAAARYFPAMGQKAGLP